VSVFKREDSEYYWYKFSFKGKLYQRPARVKNRRQEEKIETAFRTQLANGEVGLEHQEPAPTLEAFIKRFSDHVHVHNKSATVRFYLEKSRRLVEWEPLKQARLNHIDEALIERYIGVRLKKVALHSVNHELRTLRRMLHLALEWKVIRAVPKVRLLPGEKNRDFVLDPKTEQTYLAACPSLLRDAATVLVDSGLRLGEAVALRWSDIHLEPAGDGRYGWLYVRDGKSKNATRTVPLTLRANSVLKDRMKGATSEWVFPGDSPDQHILGTSLAHMHAKVCRPPKKGKGQEKDHRFPKEFVLHSLRHTALTRLGEARADSFTIKRVAGHFSVTVSERYVHPTAETVQLTFGRLEENNRRAIEGVNGNN